MTLVPPIVLADGLDVTFYGSADDVVLDVEPWYVEEDYRMYDATGRRLELVVEEDLLRVRALEHTPTGAGELAGLLRVWLPLVGADAPDLDRLALRDLLDRAVERAGIWDPRRDVGVPRGLGVAFLLLVAGVITAALASAVANTDGIGAVVEAVAGGAAVAALLAAAVQVLRRRPWQPWVAAHVALMAVALVAILVSGS